MKTTLLTLVWVLLFQVLLLGQNPRLSLRQYTMDDGLPSQNVNEILQDRDGYFWLATGNGLCRFDGYDFKIFTIEQGLEYPNVLLLEEDHQGRIWLLTISGLVFYYEKGKIFPFRNNHIIRGLKNQFVVPNDFHLAKDGKTLYLGLGQLGILQIDTVGKYQIHKASVNKGRIALDFGDQILTQISSFQKSKPDSKTKNSNKTKFTNQKKAPTFYPPMDWHRGDSIIKITNIQKRPDGNTAPGDIFPYRPTQYFLGYGRQLVFLNQFQPQWYIPFPKNVFRFWEDAEGGLYFCTDEGLRRYANLEALRKNEYEALLADVAVRWLYQDRQGGIWIATRDRGFFYTPDIRIRIYDHFLDKIQGKVAAFAPKKEREWILATSTGTVFELDLKKSMLHQLPLIPVKGFPDDLKYDPRNGWIWLANNYPIYWNGQRWQLMEDHIAEGNSNVSAPAKRLAFSKDSTYIWAASSQAILSINALNGKVRTNSLRQQRLDGSNIIAEDRLGNVWVGRENGLFCWEKEQLIASKKPKWSGKIIAITFLPNNQLVLGTEGKGLLIQNGDTFKQWTEAEGLRSNQVHSITIDKKNRIIALTRKGISVLTPSENGNYKLQNFTTAQGLPADDILAIYQTDTHFWIATPKGIAKVPDEIATSPDNVPLITTFLVNNEKRVANFPMHLAYNQNNLKFQFRTLNYRLGKQTAYRYRLSLDVAWNYVRENQIEFPMLADAHYPLEVQARNENGSWSASAAFPITILAPWWQTWWFRTLVLGILFAIGFGFYKYRTNNLKKQLRLQQQVTEVERAALRAQMNPHFIFNCLNSIQSLIHRGDKENATQYLVHFAGLVRGILNTSLRERIMLEDEISYLESYLSLEKLRFKDRFNYYIEIADEIDCFDTEIPPMMIQPFVENAIVHGLKNKDTGGQIHIQYAQQNGHLLITVTDNGIGYSKSKALKIKEEPLHQSVGITLTERRLALLNGNENTDNLKIEDLTNEAGECIGTRVELKIAL